MCRSVSGASVERDVNVRVISSSSSSPGRSHHASFCRGDMLLGLPPFQFPNPGRGSGAEPPADGRPGVSPPENVLNSVCDLVHFCAIRWQLFVGRRTRYICSFAIKIEPICQLQCPHDYTATLSLLSNEHALKSGRFGVPGLVVRAHGTAWDKSGTSREIRDGWQPYMCYVYSLHITATGSPTYVELPSNSEFPTAEINNACFYYRFS